MHTHVFMYRELEIAEQSLAVIMHIIKLNETKEN